MSRLVAATLLASLVAAPTVLGSNSRPALRLLDRQPFVVEGKHFKPGERITVVLVARQGETSRATANGGGSFTVNFGDVQIDRCEGYSVRATGSLGSRAWLKPFAPACLPDAAPLRSPG